MTEEELAASLGLTETDEMRALRPDILRLAPRGDEGASLEFIDTLSCYQQLGKAIVDAKPDSGDYFRMSAQIALILLSASIRRDIAAHNPSYVEYWAEDLDDALTYASNISLLGLTFDLAEAIELLIANGPASHNN